LKGGVIMDVHERPTRARIRGKKAGRFGGGDGAWSGVTFRIFAKEGRAWRPDGPSIKVIREIMKTVTIPVMAQGCAFGHFFQKPKVLAGAGKWTSLTKSEVADAGG